MNLFYRTYGTEYQSNKHTNTLTHTLSYIQRNRKIDKGKVDTYLVASVEAE